MSTQAIARPIPVRSNRIRDLLYVASSLIIFTAVFQVWEFATDRLVGSVETVGMVAASIFPVAALPIYTRLALGMGPMIVQLVAFAALVQAVPERLPLFGVQVIVGGIVGAALASNPKGRGSVVTAGTWAGVASAVVFLMVFADRMPTPSLVGGAIGAIVSGTLSGALVLALSPLIERVFGHVTPLTLLEALSYDHPLLRRLITQAPGTFLHSTNLAVLADAAARAIGANGLAVRVGALYHDVGKTLAADDFIENQRGEARDDPRSAEEIARSLVQHVTDGAALILSHGLGQLIADFALEHHGTSPMRSLARRAEREGVSNSRLLQYPGPRPRSRETAIVMIGDPSTRDECQQLVRETVARILADQQLVYAGLSAEDLNQMETVFTDVLHAIHHRRVGYAASDITPPAIRVGDAGGPQAGADA
jgi:cyclic-di-AMP phosphodiesterase PgpH